VSRPFIILASSRKGTHLIETAISQHPDILSHGQMLSNIGKEYQVPESRAELVARLFDGPLPVAVVSLAWGQANDPPTGLWDELRTRNVGVIYLHRRNMLRWYVSWRLAKATGEWISSHSSTPPNIQIAVDPAICLAEIQADWQREMESREWFANQSSLHLWYEDITRNFDAEIARIQRFLEVQALCLRPTCYKQQTRPLSDVIANYAMLCEVWRGTPWEWFMRDDACPGVLPVC